MKVGDLVKPWRDRLMSFDKSIGVVIEMGKSEHSVKVHWSGNYGTFWTRTNLLENLSESK